MKNNVSMQRIFLLLKRHFAEIGQKALMLYLITDIVLLLFPRLSALAFVIFYFSVFYFVASDFSTKNRIMSYLLLPANTIEKYLTIILQILLYNVLIIANMYFINWLNVQIHHLPYLGANIHYLNRNVFWIWNTIQIFAMFLIVHFSNRKVRYISFFVLIFLVLLCICNVWLLNSIEFNAIDSSLMRIITAMENWQQKYWQTFKLTQVLQYSVSALFLILLYTALREKEV